MDRNRVQESGGSVTASVNVRGAEPAPNEYSTSGVSCEPYQLTTPFDVVQEDGAWKVVLDQETLQGIAELTQ